MHHRRSAGEHNCIWQWLITEDGTRPFHSIHGDDRAIRIDDRHRSTCRGERIRNNITCHGGTNMQHPVPAHAVCQNLGKSLSDRTLRDNLDRKSEIAQSICRCATNCPASHRFERHRCEPKSRHPLADHVYRVGARDHEPIKAGRAPQCII